MVTTVPFCSAQHLTLKVVRSCLEKTPTAQYELVLAPFLYNFQPLNMAKFKLLIMEKGIGIVDVITRCKGGEPKAMFLYLVKMYSVLSEGKQCDTLVAILERILAKESQEMKRFLETNKSFTENEAENAVSVVLELLELIVNMAGPHYVVAVRPQHLSKRYSGKCTVRSNGDVRSVEWSDDKTDSAASDCSFEFSRRNPVKLICSFAQSLETANAARFITCFSEKMCTKMITRDSEDVQEQAVVLWSDVVYELGVLPSPDQTSDTDLEVGYFNETILTQFLFDEVLKMFQRLHRHFSLEPVPSSKDRSKQLLLNIVSNLLSTERGVADLERLAHIRQALGQVFSILSLDAASAVEERLLALAREHLGLLQIERFRTDLSVLLLLYASSTNLRHDTSAKDLLVTFAKTGCEQCKYEVFLLLQEELKHCPQVFTSLLRGAVQYLIDSNQLPGTFLQLLTAAQDKHPLQELASRDKSSLLEASDAILRLLKGAFITRSDDELDLLLSMALDMLSCPDVVASELVNGDSIKVFADLLHRRPSQATACILTVIAEHRLDRLALLQTAIDQGCINVDNLVDCDIAAKTFTELLRDSTTVNLSKESSARLGDVWIKTLLKQLETAEALTSAHKSKLKCLLQVLSDKDLGGQILDTPTSICFSDYVRAAGRSVCPSLARFCARNLRCSSNEAESCLVLGLLFRLCNVDEKRTKDSLSRVFPRLPLPSSKSPLELMSCSDFDEEQSELFFPPSGTSSGPDMSVVVTQGQFTTMSKKLSVIWETAEKLKDSEVIVPYPQSRKRLTGENQVEIFGEVYSVVTPPPEFESHIPEKPLTHVPSTIANVSLVLQSQDQGFPLLIEGQTGVGKSSTVMEAARLLNRPVVRFNLSSSVTCSDIIGRVSLSSDSNGLLKYEKGPFTKAFENGLWLLLDELNLACDEILQSIESALDTDLLYIDDPASGETSAVIKKHEHFRLFATQNPHTGSFRGTRNSLSSAFVSRFHTVSFDSPSNEDLEAIVTDVLILAASSRNRECAGNVEVIAKQWARRMVTFHYKLRMVKMDSEKSQPYAEITVRDLLKWATGMSTVLKENISAKNVLNQEQVNERFVFEARCVYETRFRDDETRKAIQQALLDSNAFGFKGFQAEPPLPVDYRSKQRSEAEKLSIGPCIVYDDFQADYPVGDPLSMSRFHRKFTDHIREKSRGILFCPLQVDQWIAKCGDKGWAKNTILTIGFELYARYLPCCFHNDLKNMLKEQWDAVNINIKFKDVEPEFVAPFVVTDYVKKAWMYILHALKQQQPILLVGPGGCGKSDMILWLASLLGKHVNSWCLTSDTETSDLVGKIIPKKPAEWVDGVVTKSVKRGQWLLLDNINEAEPAVLERLNPLLEQKPMWVLTEKGETENMFDSYLTEDSQTSFRFLATMTAPASCRDILKLSPSLANRFTIISLTDVGFAEGPTRHLSALLLYHDNPRLVLDEKGAGNSPKMKTIKELEKYLFEVVRITEIPLRKGLSISLRTLVRIILGAHRIHKKFEDRCSLAQALVTACDMCVMQQIQDRKGPDYKSIKEMFECLRKGIAASEGLSEIKPFDFVTEDLLGQGEYALDRVKTPSRYHYANVILYAFYTGQAVLLEGPAATGKSSLVEFIGRNLKKMGSAGTLFKTINSESTSVQDYFGTFIPCGDGNFAELQGPLTAALSEGAFFLSDEFNLAEPSVLNALFPLLEGRQSMTNPVSGEHIDVKKGFLFFATQNSTLYADRKQLSPSLRSRFLQMQVSDFAPDELAFILQTRKFSGKVPFKNVEDTVLLEKTFRAINEKIQCRALMLGTNSTLRLTVRDLIKWIERFIALSRRRDNEGGLVSLATAGLAMLAPKLKPAPLFQRSKSEEPVTSLMKVMVEAGMPKGDVPSTIEKPYITIQDKNCLLFDGITYSSLKLDCDDETIRKLSRPSNPEQYKRGFAQAHVALQCREPVLLIGPTTFKSKLARDYLVARGTGYDRFVVIQLSSDTQVGDLIGQIHPYQFDAAVGNLITTAQQLCDRLKLCDLKDDKQIALDYACQKLGTCWEFLKSKIKPTAAGYTTPEDNPMEVLTRQETITSIARDEAENEIFDDKASESDYGDESSESDISETTDNFPGQVIKEDNVDSEDDYYPADDSNESSYRGERNGKQSAQVMVTETSKRSAVLELMDDNTSGNQPNDLKQKPLTQSLEGTADVCGTADSDDYYYAKEDEGRASGKDTTVADFPENLGRHVRKFKFASDDCFHDVSKLLSKAVEGLNDETIAFLMKKYLSTLSLLKQASTNIERPVFLFRDGPVTRAVKEGRSIIFEDINLPSQAVIERLNSLFEASRVLGLSEDVSASIVTLLPDRSQPSSTTKPGNNAVSLLKDSCLFATVHVNDLSEKICLSPALRSRFSEILFSDLSADDIANVCEDYCRNSKHLRKLACSIREYLSAVQKSLSDAGYFQLTLKESVTWIKMMEGLASSLHESVGDFNEMELFLVTARFVLLDPTPQAKRPVVCNAFMDSLGIEITKPEEVGCGSETVRRVSATAQNLRVSEEKILWFYRGQSESLCRSSVANIRSIFVVSNGYIKLRDLPVAAKVKQRLEGLPDDASLEERLNFTLTPTSLSNIARILASMASDLPLLLEGPPGIGKTAVVVQCAKLLGYEVDRINFTKDTSVDTLIGKHIPRMDERGGHMVFTWQDGRALEAYKDGRFLLLDEINLASQEVLDELKNIIDPEISSYTVRGENKRVNRHGDFRVFATMNPASVGGGRGRLPQSIESMFMKVHLQKYSATEETQICFERFASSGLIGDEGSVLGEKELNSLVSLHQEVKELVDCKDIGKQGGPYDFNVRDLLKVGDVIKGNMLSLLSHLELSETDVESSDVRYAFLSDVARIGALRTSCELVYSRRFRSLEDQEKVTEIVDRVFDPSKAVVHDVTLDQTLPRSVRIGFVYLSKGDYDSPFSPLIQTASLNRYLQLLASAVLSGRVVFLQGPTCSRKTALVCELSRICSRKLHIIPFSEDTETDRLIGRWSPYESAAISRADLEKCHSIFTKSLQCLLSWGLAFTPKEGVRCQLLDELCVVLEKFHQAEEQINSYLLSESVEMLWKAFDLVIEGNEDAHFDNKLVIQAQLKREQRLLNDCLVTIRRYGQLASDDDKGFHFVESLLVEAIRKGEWVLLDNLSAAPSDVVERILSLAETPQTLHLFESPRNETLSSGSGIDPEFRLFATVTSSRESQDKLSSALLNRVISFWVPALDADALVNFKNSCEIGVGTELYDIVAGQMAEVPASVALAKVLVKLHCGLSNMWWQGRLETVGRVEFTGRTALRTAERVVQLCRRRASPVEALAAAVGEHYVKCCRKNCQSIGLKVLAKELNERFSKDELQRSPAMVTPTKPEIVRGKSLLMALCRKTLADLLCFVIGFLCYHLTIVYKARKNTDVCAATTFLKKVSQKSLKRVSQTDDLKAHLSRVDTAISRTESADLLEKEVPFHAVVVALEEYGVTLSKTTGSDVQCKAVGVTDLRGYSDVVEANLLTLGEQVEAVLKKSSFSNARRHLSFSKKLSEWLKAAQEVIWRSGWLSLSTSERKIENARGATDLFEALQTVQIAVVKCSQRISVLHTAGAFLPHLDVVCESLRASDATGTGVCGTYLHRILEEEIMVNCERNRLIQFLNRHKILPTKPLAQLKLLFVAIELLVGTSSSVPYQLREVELVDNDDFSEIWNELSLVECSQYMCSQLLDLCTNALWPLLHESKNMRKEVKSLQGLRDTGNDQKQRHQTAVKRSIERVERLSNEFIKSRETVLNSDDAKYLFSSYQHDLQTLHSLIFRELAALKASTEDTHESYRSLLQRLRPQELEKSLGPLWIIVFSELRSYIWSEKMSWEVCLVTSKFDLNGVALRNLDQLILFVSDNNTSSKFGVVTVTSRPKGKVLVFCSEPSDSHQETLLASVVELVERHRSRKATWISVVAEELVQPVSYQQVTQFLPAIVFKKWHINERLQKIVISADEFRQLEQSFSEQCQRLGSLLRRFPERLVRHQLLKIVSCMQDLYQLPVGIADVSATDWGDVEKKASSFEQTVTALKTNFEGDLTTRKSNVIPSHPHQRQQFLMKVEFDHRRHLGRLSRNDAKHSPCIRVIRLLGVIKETAKEHTKLAGFLRGKSVLSLVPTLTRTMSVIANGIVLAADAKSCNWSLGDKHAPLRNCIKIGDHDDGLEFLSRRCQDLKSHCTDVFKRFGEGTVDITLDYDRLRTELESSKTVITDVCQALAKCDIELDFVDSRDCIDVLTQVSEACYSPQEDTETKEETPVNMSDKQRKEMERRLSCFISELTNLYHSVCNVDPRPVALIVSIMRDIEEASTKIEDNKDALNDFIIPEALTRRVDKYRADVDTLLASDHRGEGGRITNLFEQSEHRKELQDITVSSDRAKPMLEEYIRYEGDVTDLGTKAESIYRKDNFEELVQLTAKLDGLVRLSIADSRWNYIYSKAEELRECLRTEVENRGRSSPKIQTELVGLIAVQDRSKQHMATTKKLLTSSSLSVSDMDDVANVLLSTLLQTRCDHHLSGLFDGPNSFTVLQTVCKPVVKHTAIRDRGTLLNTEGIFDICLKRSVTFDVQDRELYRNETTRFHPIPVRMTDLHFGIMETDTVGCKHFMECERQMEKDLSSLKPLSKPRHLGAVVEAQIVDILWDNRRDFHLKSMQVFVEVFNGFFAEYDAGDAMTIRSFYRSLSEVPEYTVVVGVVGICSCVQIMGNISSKVREGFWDFTPFIRLCDEEKQRQKNEDKQRIEKDFLMKKRDLVVSYKRERSRICESDTMGKEEELKSLEAEHRRKVEELQRKKETSVHEQLQTARKGRLRKVLVELSNRLEKAAKVVEEFLNNLTLVWCKLAGVRIPQVSKTGFVADQQCSAETLRFIAFLTKSALERSHKRQDSKDVTELSESGSAFQHDPGAVKFAVESLLSFFQTQCSLETPFCKRLQRLMRLLSVCAGCVCSGVEDIERKRFGLNQYHSTSVLRELCEESKRFATQIEEDCQGLYNQCCCQRADLQVVCLKGQGTLKLIRDLRDGRTFGRLLQEVLIYTSNMVMKFLVLVLLFVERREKCTSELVHLRLAIKRFDPIMMEEYSSRALETEVKTAYKHVRSAAQQLDCPLEILLFDFVGDVYPIAIADASVAKRCKDHASASVYGQALGRKLTWFLRIPQVSEEEVKHTEKSLKCLQAILNQAVRFEELSDSFIVGCNDDDNFSLSVSFEQCHELTDRVKCLCDNLIARHEIADASQSTMANAKLFVHQLYSTLLDHHIYQFKKCSQPRLLLESTEVDEKSLKLRHFIDFARVVELSEIVFSKINFFYSLRLYASFLFECILATGRLLKRHFCEMPIAPAGLAHMPEVLDNFVNVLSTCTEEFAMPVSRLVPMEDLPGDRSTEVACENGICDLLPAILRCDPELWETCRHHVCLWLKRYVSESNENIDSHLNIVKEIEQSTAVWKRNVTVIYSEVEANFQQMQGKKGLRNISGWISSLKALLLGPEKPNAKKVNEYLDKRNEAAKILQEACAAAGMLFQAHPNNQGIACVRLQTALLSVIERYNNILLQKEGCHAELFDLEAVDDFKCLLKMVDLAFSLKQTTGNPRISCTVHHCHPSVEIYDSHHEVPGRVTVVLPDDDVRNLKLSFAANGRHLQTWKLPPETCEAICDISTPQMYEEDISFQVQGIKVTVSLSCNFYFIIEPLSNGKTTQHVSKCFDSCCAATFDVVNNAAMIIDTIQWSAFPNISNDLSKLKGGQLYEMQKKAFDSWEVNQLASGEACNTLTELLKQSTLARTNAERSVEQLNTMAFDDYVSWATRISKLLSAKMLNSFRVAQLHLKDFLECVVPQCPLVLEGGQLGDEMSSALSSLTNLCRRSLDVAAQNYAIAVIVRGGLALLCALTARGRQRFSKCQPITETTWLKHIFKSLQADNAKLQSAENLTNDLLCQAQYVEKMRSSCEEAATAKLLSVKEAGSIPHLQNQILVKCRRDPSLHLYPTDSGFQLSCEFLILRLSSMPSDQWSPATRLTIFNHSEVYDAEFEFEPSVHNDTLAIDPVKGAIQRSQHRIVIVSFTEKHLRDGRNKNTDMKQLRVLTVRRHNIDCHGTSGSITDRSQVAVVVTGRLQCIDNQLQVGPQRIQFGPLRTTVGLQTKWILVRNKSDNNVTVSAELKYHDGTDVAIADLSCTVDTGNKQTLTANEPLHWSLKALSYSRISLKCAAGPLPGRMDASLCFQFASGKEEIVNVKCLVAKPQFGLCRPGSQISIASKSNEQMTAIVTTKSTDNVQDDAIVISNTGVVPFLVSESVDCRYLSSVPRETQATSVLLPRASMKLKVLYQQTEFDWASRIFNCAGWVITYIHVPTVRNRTNCSVTFNNRSHVLRLPVLSSMTRERKWPANIDESCYLVKRGELLLIRPLHITLSLSNAEVAPVNVRLKSGDERLLLTESMVEVAGLSYRQIACKFQPTAATLFRVPLAVEVVRPSGRRPILRDSNSKTATFNVEVTVPVRTELSFERPEEQESRHFLVMERLAGIYTTDHRVVFRLCGQGSATYQTAADTVNCSVLLRSRRNPKGKPPPWTGSLSRASEMRTIEVRRPNHNAVVGCAIRFVSEDGYTIVSGEVVPAVSTLYLVDRSLLVQQSSAEERCPKIMKTIDESFSLLRESLREVASDQRKATVKVVNAILNRFPFSNKGVHSKQQLGVRLMKAAEDGDLLAVSNVLVDCPCPIDIAEPGRILASTQDNKLLSSVLCTLSSLQSIKNSFKLDEEFFDAVSESLILPKAKPWPNHWGLIHKFISALTSLLRCLRWKHSTTKILEGLLEFLSTLRRVCIDLPSICPDETRRRISLATLTKCQWYQDVTIHAVPEAAVNICCLDCSTIDGVIVALQPLIGGEEKHVALHRLESALKLSLEPCDVLNIARHLKQDLTDTNNNIPEHVVDSLSRALNSSPCECVSFQCLQTLLCELVSACHLPDFVAWVNSTMSSVVFYLTSRKPADPDKLREVLSDLLDGAMFDEENRSLCNKVVSNLTTVWQKTNNTLDCTKATANLISLFIKGKCVAAFDQMVECLISASTPTNFQQMLLSTLRGTLRHGSTFLKDITAAARSVMEGFHHSSSVGSVLPCLFEFVRVLLKVLGEDPSVELKQFQECLGNVTGLSEDGHLSRLIGALSVAQMIFRSHCPLSQGVEKLLRCLVMCLGKFQSQHTTDGNLLDVDEETDLLQGEDYNESASSCVRYSFTSDFFSLARCIILLGSKRNQDAYERVVTTSHFLCSAEFPRLIGQCFASPLPALASAMVDLLALLVENNVEVKLRLTAKRIGYLVNSRLQFRNQMISNLLPLRLATATDCSILQKDLDVSLSVLSRENQNLSACKLRCLGNQGTETSEEVAETLRIALADIEWYDVSLSNYFRFVSSLCNTDDHRLSSTAEELYSVALKRLTCLPRQRDTDALTDVSKVIDLISDMLPPSRRQLLDGVVMLISCTREWSNDGTESLLYATMVLQRVLAIANLTKVELWSDVLYLFQEVSKQQESNAEDTISDCHQLLGLDSLNLSNSFWENFNCQCDNIQDDSGYVVSSSWKHLVIFLKELGSCTPSESHICAGLGDVLNIVFSASEMIDFQSVVALMESLKRLIQPIDAQASSTLCKIVSLLQSMDESQSDSSWEQNLQTLMEEEKGMVDCLVCMVSNLSFEKNVVLADAVAHCSHLAMKGGVSFDLRKQTIFNDIFLVCDELISNPECGWSDIRRLIDTLFSLFDSSSGFLLSNGQNMSPQMIMSILDALDICWHSEAADHGDEGRQRRTFSLSAVALYELALHVAVMMKVPSLGPSGMLSPETEVTAGLSVDQGLIAPLGEIDEPEQRQLSGSNGKEAGLQRNEEVETADEFPVDEFDTLVRESEEFGRFSSSQLQSGPGQDFCEKPDGAIMRAWPHEEIVDEDGDSDESDILSLKEGILSFKKLPHIQVLLPGS